MMYKGAHRMDVPKRTDLGKLPGHNSPANKEALYGMQKGHCAGCNEHFKDRHLEVDHIIARNKGGTDHIENLVRHPLDAPVVATAVWVVQQDQGRPRHGVPVDEAQIAAKP